MTAKKSPRQTRRQAPHVAAIVSTLLLLGAGCGTAADEPLDGSSDSSRAASFGGGGKGDCAGAACEPVCGNEVVESGEECDDGGPSTKCNADCTVRPTAFRIVRAEVRDPHFWVDPFLVGCTDVTEEAPAGFDGVNEMIAKSIARDSDDDADGFLDLSLLMLFQPLDPAASGTIEVGLGDCTDPTNCKFSSGLPTQAGSYRTGHGDCLQVDRSTLSPGNHSPPVRTPNGACFASERATIGFNFGGTPILLQDGQVSAEFDGAPVSRLVQGVIKGFVSEADARNTDVQGDPLSDYLADGEDDCPGYDDRDVGPNGELGWYFYIEFEAAPIPWE